MRGVSGQRLDVRGADGTVVELTKTTGGITLRTVVRGRGRTPWRRLVTFDDGTTVEVAPEAAAALTTAAATGGQLPVDVEVPDGISPQTLALTAPEGVTCRVSRPRGLAAEELTETGLTPRAQAVNDAVQATFGPIPDGGYAPGGISTGHGARSEHYHGRAVDLFFRPVGDEAQRARGWAVANWLVAHAQEYGVSVIIFDDRIWSTRRSAQGWRPYSNPDGYTNDVGRHLDHVHVDVIEGT